MAESTARPEELESAFVACLKAIDDLMEAREVLEADLRAGFLDVARAKYVMGPMRVSSLQYDKSCMETTTFVVTSGENMGGPATEGTPPREWSLVRKTADEAPAQQPTESVATSMPQKTELRRRAPRGHKSGNTSEAAEEVRACPLEAEREGGGSSSKRRSDGGQGQGSPLRWFGGLVSPHLHHAQSHFVTALEHVMDVVRAQSQVQAAQARFDRLRGISDGDGNKGESGGEDSEEDCITVEHGL